MGIFEPVFRALNESGARYVIVGGLATVLHGHARLTADIDLIVDFDPPEARKVVEALEAVGLRPRAPVRATDFADPEERHRWVADKGMQVFSLWNPGQPLLEVDLFVEHPISFEELWRRARGVTVDDTEVWVASLPDLIALKRLAGRPEDLQDIEALEAIAAERGNDDA